MRLRTPLFVVALAGSLLIAPAAAQAVPCAVTDVMIKASAAWVTKGTDLKANNWSNANFHTGNIAQVRTTGISNHKTWPWVKANKYLLPVDPANPYAPDPQSSGEAYLAVSFFHPEPEVLQPLRDNLRAQAKTGKHDYWKSPDALNMSLPSFTEVAVRDLDQDLLDYSYRSYRSLKNADVQRDHRPVGPAPADQRLGRAGPREGDPDAACATTRTAPTTRRPCASPRRRSSCCSATTASGASPARTPPPPRCSPTRSPPASTRACSTRTPTCPRVQKGWAALLTAIDADGLLGYVQARGSNKPASATDTAGFGVGSLLIAGQQVVRLTPGC